MKLLAFGASNHHASINAKLARYSADRFKSQMRPNAVVTYLDLNDFEMPIYSIKRQNENGIHPLATQIFAKMGAADALIISFPEYNGSYSSAWKNIHDWMSRIEMQIYQNKPLLALSATPGSRAGAGVLGAVTESASFFGAKLRGAVGVGGWGEAYDEETQRLVRENDISRIDEALSQLSKY